MRVKQELNKKLNKMTCKDCKYYNEDYELFPPYAKCDKQSGEVINYVIKSDDGICHDFVPIEDAWESVSK